MKLGLSPEELAERRRGIGGSDANILMSGDPGAIFDLWLVKTGQQPDADLSGVLPVQLGLYTEPFNRAWFERQHNRAVTNAGEIVCAADEPFRRCTLDGYTLTQEGEPAIFEGKHVNAFSKIEDVVQRYQPQLHHNMAVTGRRWAVVSVLIGTMDYEAREVAFDDFYAAELLDRERAFWRCVEQNIVPPGCEPIAPPPLPTKFREADLTGHNEWASHAHDWLTTRRAAKDFERAEKGLKGLVEADVSLAFGHGVAASRDKAGRLRLKEFTNGTV